MSALNVTIEGYGAIQRKIPSQIVLNYSDTVLVSDVLNDITHQYPDATQAMERCACAIGVDIISRQTYLSQNCTLVLLSPVAGG